MSALLFVLLSGCAVQRAQEAADAKAQMIGMSKEQVLSCAGIPTQKAAEGQLELWSYVSGNGYTNTAVSANVNSYSGYTNGTAEGISTRRYCVVNIAMEDGRVKQVTYAGPTGGLLTAGEQCAFAVRNCLRPTG
jgi:outer membrane protein assembly factor BamE (lipoprotein component of BamABCDE complex)